jgi:RNA polymerase sigma factor (sigma-70 family)
LEQQKGQFELRIKEHTLLIHKLCHMYAFTNADREDLFQNIVLQLWKSFPLYKGEASISTWIYRVGINTAISSLRKRKDFIITSSPDNLPFEIADETNDAVRDEQLESLNKAIENLNEIEKAIVLLYMEDRSYKEMELILGISEGALRAKMNRIKKKLRELTKS